MQQGNITAWAECKITDHRSDTKFIGTKHKPYDNGYKPAERSLTGKAGFKVAQNIFDKI